MSSAREEFQEQWAANMVRRMGERIEAALRKRAIADRRAALSAALDLGKEARLRIQSEPTHSEAEREGLRCLQNALDQAQAALNAYDPRDDSLLREAFAQAEAAAAYLDRG